MTGQCPCSRPTDAYLCNVCVANFLKDLRAVPDLLAELHTTGAKLDVMGGGGGGGSVEAPMGVNIGALETKGTLEHLLLAMWMRCGLTAARWDPITAVEGITAAVHVLAGHKSAASYRDQLAAEVRKGWEMVDQRRHMVRLGDCLTVGCETPLTVDDADMPAPGDDKHQPEVRCTTCGNTYNIRAYLRIRTADALGYNGQPMRAAESVRYLRKRGVGVTPKQIENWVKWGRITPAGLDDKGRKLFNLEDVYKLAARKAA